jgi:hypothetical protein
MGGREGEHNGGAGWAGECEDLANPSGEKNTNSRNSSSNKQERKEDSKVRDL